MVGQRLEANVHVVTSSISATQNLVTAANRAGILITDTVLEPLASAESCSHAGRARPRLLPARHRRRHDRTDRLRRRSRPPHQRRCPSAATTSATILPSACARRFPKRKESSASHGCALASTCLPRIRAIEIASVGDRPPRMIFARMLTDIIEPRANGIARSDRAMNCSAPGCDKQIPAGFVLAGGGAQALTACSIWPKRHFPSARAYRRAEGSRRHAGAGRPARICNGRRSGDVRRASPPRGAATRGKFGIKIKVHVRGRFVNRPRRADNMPRAMRRRTGWPEKNDGKRYGDSHELQRRAVSRRRSK